MKEELQFRSNSRILQHNLIDSLDLGSENFVNTHMLLNEAKNGKQKRFCVRKTTSIDSWMSAPVAVCIEFQRTEMYCHQQTLFCIQEKHQNITSAIITEHALARYDSVGCGDRAQLRKIIGAAAGEFVFR